MNRTKPLPLETEAIKATPLLKPQSPNYIRCDQPPTWLAEIYQDTPVRHLLEKLGALTLLVMISPIFILCFFLVKLTSQGPAIYSQVRVGKHGKLFRLRKFRTMYSDAEAHTGAVLSWANDPRITTLGSIFRKTHLDEIPQLWNVICGEMSFIGPRPERPQFVDEFNSRVDLYKYRHYSLPGITGLAQVCASYHARPEEKIIYDLKYLRNRSNFNLNVTITLQTILKMLHLKQLYNRIKMGLLITHPEQIS